jgi:hypothetical protein
MTHVTCALLFFCQDARVLSRSFYAGSAAIARINRRIDKLWAKETFCVL